MLLDDTQVAIDELLASCQESAEHYADAAGQTAARPVQALFESVAARRSADARQLAQAVRDTDRLPRAPYADRRDLHQLVTQAKAALTDDELRVLLEDRIVDERQLRRLVDAALALKPADDEAACAQRIGAHSDEVLERLRAEVSARPNP